MLVCYKKPCTATCVVALRHAGGHSSDLYGACALHLDPAKYPAIYCGSVYGVNPLPESPYHAMGPNWTREQIEDWIAINATNPQKRGKDACGH